MTTQGKTFATLEDIRVEKERLRLAMSEKGEEVSMLWQELVHPAADDEVKTPTQRLLHYAHAGAGLVDGVIMGWKLYRRIGGTFSFFKRKKRK